MLIAVLEDGRWVEPQMTMGGSGGFSGGWPRSGSMRGGRAYAHPTTVPLIGGTGCSSPALLPTPTAANRNDGEDPATWLARADRLKAKHGNGNGAGMPLAIAVQLLPTPSARDGKGRDITQEGGPSLPEAVSGL